MEGFDRRPGLAPLVNRQLIPTIQQKRQSPGPSLCGQIRLRDVFGDQRIALQEGRNYRTVRRRLRHRYIDRSRFIEPAEHGLANCEQRNGLSSAALIDQGAAPTWCQTLRQRGQRARRTVLVIQFAHASRQNKTCRVNPAQPSCDIGPRGKSHPRGNRCGRHVRRQSLKQMAKPLFIYIFAKFLTIRGQRRLRPKLTVNQIRELSQGISGLTVSGP
ncbi:hypothetical protein O4G74_09255 [Henriciella marina]|uniref:HTH-like domain-containing protein n=1 Tax=Henriciella marina TaxID=453851 RepID=A0ABT4LV34_9PROT|nr:hypothetical protein [Henriciella marina]